MIRRTWRYDPSLEFWNQIVSAGAFVIAIGLLVFIYNFWTSKRRGEIAGMDPWDARTLEWAISSPPPEYNFAKLPNVTARDDFWHRKYELKNFQPEGPGHVVLPNPTIWPLVVGAGLALLGYGFIFGYALSVIGVAIIFFGAYAWSFAKFEG
jgi:cytochrome c oxidase subunit 1